MQVGPPITDRSGWGRSVIGMDRSIVIDRFEPGFLCENQFVRADRSRNLAAMDRSGLVLWWGSVC